MKVNNKCLAIMIAALLLSLLCAACSQTVQNIHCAQCDAEISTNNSFCPHCGAAITAPKSTENTNDSVPSSAEVANETVTHTHSYSDATCTQPGVCVCGETNGEALGHSWNSATCTASGTCSRCGATNGSPLGHNWNNATCTTPKTCSNCGATDGSPLGHNWNNATCTTPKTCSNCGATSGSALGHSYTAKTTPATCTSQGYTTYTCSCGHTYKADYVYAAHKYQNYVCSSCGQVDKTHAYEHLMNWVKANGTANGMNTNFTYWSENTRYSLSYSAEYDDISVTRIEKVNEDYVYAALYLDDFAYYAVVSDIRMGGYISPSGFTSNTAITYTSYTGSSDLKSDMAEFSRISICELIEWLDWCLNSYDVGITISDLGFHSYK